MQILNFNYRYIGTYGKKLLTYYTNKTYGTKKQLSTAIKKIAERFSFDLCIILQRIIYEIIYSGIIFKVFTYFGLR